MRVTRRQLLAATTLLGGAVVAGAGSVAIRWWDQAPGTPYAVLSEDEAAILDALAEACFPAGGTPALGGAAAGVGRYFDGVLEGLALEQQKLLRLALHAIDALPLATHGGYLSELPVPDASDALASWLRSPRPELRGLAQSFSIFVGMAWMAHPAVRPRIAPMFGCGFADAGGLPDRLGAS
ncbi:MAG: hypothetical protein Q8P41_15895 [Pseudomonadota bacterium]|nr:hypothetical protein [Pseudomonadota bacterium]